jgi:hypothetical protein
MTNDRTKLLAKIPNQSAEIYASVQVLRLSRGPHVRVCITRGSCNDHRCITIVRMVVSPHTTALKSIVLPCAPAVACVIICNARISVDMP